MSEKRFYRASVCGDEGLYDKEDGCIIVNVRSNIDLEDNWNTVVEKLNEQRELIEELRLQEKDKGVPVFVVREGKNPVALFFNEQRASLYCQENMANLTYQQEKWCRVK